MGYVVRLKRNQLVGGNNNDEIYPITSTNAVYRGGKNLEDILDELGKDIDSKKVIEVSYNGSTNSIKVSYSNGDVSNYTLTDCIKDVSLNNSILTFTKTDGTVTSVNIPNIYVDANGNSFPKHGVSLQVNGIRVDFPKIIMIPTFGVSKGISLADTTNLKDAIRYRNLSELTNGDSDVCVYDFINDGSERMAVMYPRLPKVVAAVSTNGDKLRITYLEDTETSGQSYTDINLPNGGSSVSVSANNPTLERNTEKVVGNLTIDGTSTQLKVNAGDMVSSSNVADIVFTDKSTFNSLKNSGALISSRLYLVQAETSA